MALFMTAKLPEDIPESVLEFDVTNDVMKENEYCCDLSPSFF